MASLVYSKSSIIHHSRPPSRPCTAEAVAVMNTQHALDDVGLVCPILPTLDFGPIAGRSARSILVAYSCGTIAFPLSHPMFFFGRSGFVQTEPTDFDLQARSGGNVMKRIPSWPIVIVVVMLATVGGMTLAAQDKYTLQVPGGLAFSEFRAYESWQVIATSQNDKAVAVILGNLAMIDAYLAGIPGNGKPFPDGAKMAKIHWAPKPNEFFPDTTVPGAQHDVDFMVKDSTRFADSGGWGWAVVEYDAASQTFRPGTLDDEPPQANDAKCGFECHTIVKDRDYVFTEYHTR